MPKKAPKEEDESDVSSIDVDDDPDEEEETDEAANDLGNSDIVTKYRCAGDIANRVLGQLIELVQPGKTAVEICAAGDKMVEEATGKVYTAKKEGKKMEKGSAFPVCISVNNCVGHYSPLTSEDDVVLKEVCHPCTPLVARPALLAQSTRRATAYAARARTSQARCAVRQGDVIKIDLGVHVDGYIAVLAHTTMCSASGEVATGRKADVMQAVWTASECAVRMFKEGMSNTEVTAMIAKVGSRPLLDDLLGIAWRCCSGLRCAVRCAALSRRARVAAIQDLSAPGPTASQVAEAYKCTPVEGVLSHQMKKHVIDANKARAALSPLCLPARGVVAARGVAGRTSPARAARIAGARAHFSDRLGWARLGGTSPHPQCRPGSVSARRGVPSRVPG